MISLHYARLGFPETPPAVLGTKHYKAVREFVSFYTRIQIVKLMHSVAQSTDFARITLEEFVKRKSSPGLVDESE